MIRKKKKTAAALLLGLAFVVSGMLSLTACSDGEDDLDTVSISYYDELDRDENGDVIYNESLFRVNSFETIVADPFVLQVTDPASEDYGWFYLYGTVGGSYSLECYKSQDLVNWEYASLLYTTEYETDEGQAVADCYWAPEVVYDEADGYYYMFFTASRFDEDGSSRVKIHVPFVARSASPAGPFEIVSNAENENRGDTEYSCFNTDEFSLFNNDEMAKWAEELGITLAEEDDYRLKIIDLHPYQAENGEKYLYFKIEKGGDLAGVKMNSWTEPDYSTLTVLAEAGKITPGGEVNALEGSATLNEGTYVDEHNGKYYLTFSIYGYSDPRYSVCQAVSDSPLGPFRKLTAEEGGMVLSADGGSMEKIAATGHHSFIEIGDKKYIIYHAYDNMACAGSRYYCIDEIKWVTITDSTGEELDVMYCNGPTISIEPQLDINTEYTNIAGLAKAEATNVSEESNTDYLNDGLIAVNMVTNAGFMEQYVKDCEFEDDTTITLTFDDWKAVRAVMVYNSNVTSYGFENVKSIVMTCALPDGTIFKGQIEDLGFDWEQYSAYDGAGIIGGSAAIAEFDEMMVCEIEITIEKPDSNRGLSIPEIVVLGRDASTEVADKLEVCTDAYVMEQSEEEVLNDGIVVDGVLDEDIWANQNWQSFTYTSAAFSRDYTLEMTSYFGEDGLYFAFRTDDPSVYYSNETNLNRTSCIEFYLSAAEKEKYDSYTYEIDLSASGAYGINQRYPSKWGASIRVRSGVLLGANVDGEINIQNGANGYTVEYYMPYWMLGLDSEPEYVNSVPCLIVTTSEFTRERWAFAAAGYGYRDKNGVAYEQYKGYASSKPCTWMKWGKDGFIE